MKLLHSYWAYIVLILLIFTVINAISGLKSKKKFKIRDLRLGLFTLIVSHIQLLMGFIAYYTSAYYETLRSTGMGPTMKNSELRRALIEHPVTILIAIALITIGFSKHKKKTTDQAKFKSFAIFYGIALVLILAMIPWQQWLS